MENVTIEPVAVRLDTAARMLDVGRTTLWRLVRDHKLDTIRIGADQRVTVASIRRLVTDRQAAPADVKRKR